MAYGDTYFVEKPTPGLVVEYDSHGKVLQSWHGEELGGISEAVLHDGYLYLGGYGRGYMAKVPYDV